MMKRNAIQLLFLAAVFMGTIPSAAQTQDTQAESLLDSARSRYIETYNQADWEAHGNSHHSAAAVMMPNGTIIEGREAIISRFRMIFGNAPRNPPAQMTPKEVRIIGNWAWERGTWGLLNEPPSGWYVLIWQRDTSEEWLASQVIYTSR